MKKTLLTLNLILFSLLAINSKAQDNFSLGADLQSRYVWRGQALGASSPSIQPSATFSYKGFSLGTWGDFSLCNPSYQELDFSTSYSFAKDMFSVILTDYSFPQYTKDYNYFKYKDNHILECGVAFNGVKSFPLSLSVYMNILGADAKKDNGDNALSSYAEVAYKFSLKRLSTAFNIFCGFALNSAEHNSFYGNNGFACVNVGLAATKEIKINDTFSLPLSGTIICNPQAEKAYFVLSTGFHF